MRIMDIIGETAETFATRHARFQRHQAKQAKLRSKLRSTEAKARQQHRTAADQRARSETKRRDLLRQLQQPD